MSSEIDERVVSLKFKSDGFQKGADDAKRSLKALSDLTFDKAKSSLQSLGQATGKFNTSGMQSAIEQLSSRFDTLRVVGVAALATLASQAVVYGQKLVQGLLAPMKQGFEEYETNLNAVQTILANTQPAGTGLKDVNAALQELNLYSDQTIYNFSEMARNIGTFTAAGVALGPATSAIKGIANLAALSGSNSQQASSAMYQLSQAISSGKVGLQDWNSVVNAGMGGTIFQRALAQNAVKMGKLSESAVQLSGDMKNVKIDGESFRDSISATGGKASWLTSDVLTSTLAQFTGDLKDADLAAQGFNESEIKAIQQQAKTAKAAATEVKTFTQLMGTLAEAQGSGWSQSFQLIFGDFEQAKKLFTGVSNTLGGLISASSNARNKILGDWQAAGGRDAGIEAVANLWKALVAIVKPIGEAFREIFPPIQGKMLADATKTFAAFTKTLIIGGPAADNLKSTFKGLFAILHIGVSIIKGVLSVVGSLFGAIFSGSGEAAGGLLDFTGGIGDFLVRLDEFLTSGNLMSDFFKTLGVILVAPIKGIVALGKAIGGFFAGLDWDIPDISIVIGRIADRLESLGVVGQFFVKVWSKVTDFFTWAWQALQPFFEWVGKIGGQLKDALADSIKSGDFNTVLDVINTAFIGGIFLLFKGFFGKLKGLFKRGKGGGGGLLDSVKEVFGGMTETLETMQGTLKAKTLLTIAIAIGVLAASAIALSLIDSKRLTAALIAMTVMFAQLSGSMAVFSKVAGLGGIAKIPVLAAGMIVLGAAIFILASAVAKLSGLDWGELARGLTGVTGLLVAMAGSAQLFRGAGPGLIQAGAGMVVLAVAVKILASAAADFAKLSWEEIAKGLTGVASVLASVIIFNKLSAANKGAAISAVNILLLGAAMKLFASAVSDFSSFDLGAMTQGLIGVGVTLGLLVAFTRTAGNPVGLIATATAMVILGVAMKEIAKSVLFFAAVKPDSLVRGLLGMAGALAAIVIAMRLLPKGMILQAAGLLVVAAALKVMASAIQDMGGMSWEEIGKGMVVLGGSLLILAGAMYLMQAALPGAAALIVAAGALALLAPPLMLLSGLTWGEIGAGIGALGIALAVLAVGGVALLPAIPGLLGLGVALGLIGIGVGVAAAGLGLLAIGLVAIGTAGPLAATGVTAIATAVLNLLPLAMQKLGEGIVAFADVISTSGPTLVAAFVTLIQSLLDAINTVAPQILDTLIGLLTMMLNSIQANLPMFIQKGFDILVGFLTGIANNMPRVIDVATQIIVNFINGIAGNIGEVVTAGTNLIIQFIRAVADNAVKLADEGGKAVVKFVNGVASSIERNSADLRAAGGRLAAAIVDGMTGGLLSGASKAISAAKDMAGRALQSAKDALGIASPSKEFYRVGAWSAEGQANGMDANGKKVERSAAAIGSNTLDTMKSAMKRVSDEMYLSLDGNQPTIRPVLDLSNVRRDASQIAGMMGKSNIKTEQSYASAVSASQGIAENRQAEEQRRETQPVSNSKSLTYAPTFTSPKALSESEIYRQNKNLMSEVVGELED